MTWIIEALLFTTIDAVLCSSRTIWLDAAWKSLSLVSLSSSRSAVSTNCFIYSPVKNKITSNNYVSRFFFWYIKVFVICFYLFCIFKQTFRSLLWASSVSYRENLFAKGISIQITMWKWKLNINIWISPKIYSQSSLLIFCKLAGERMCHRLNSRSVISLNESKYEWREFRVRKVKFRAKYCFVLEHTVWFSIAIKSLNHFSFRSFSRENPECSQVGFYDLPK